MPARAVKSFIDAPSEVDSVRGLCEFLLRFSQSGALRSRSEIEAASRLVSWMGLSSHHDPQKNWDSLKCLAHVLALGDPSSPVLDAGSSRTSVILNWLYRLGYSELFACDIRDKTSMYTDSMIQFSIQDMSKTTYQSGFFQAVTCISVIEHGVELKAFSAEMSRILRPGGYLLVSTDYWSEPIDCSGIFPYGPDAPEMKVFLPGEISEFVSIAAGHGLYLTGPLDLSTDERAVHWARVDRRYTFQFLAFRMAG